MWVVVGLAAGLLVKRMENSDEKLPAWNLNEWGGRWQVQRHQTNPNPGLKKKNGKAIWNFTQAGFEAMIPYSSAII